MASGQLSVYRPIALAGEIRLLRFKQESTQDEISCEIRSFRQGDVPRPQYYTLSYVWGEPKFSKQIQVDNKPFFVTPGLFKLLQALHSPKFEAWTFDAIRKDDWFWVDAICINQASLQERVEQVLQMGTIYTETRFTLAWLGPDGGDAMEAMDLIGKIAAARNKDGSGMSFVREVLTQTIFLSSWIALDRLFRRPWWRRTWIRQECILPKRYVLVCGNHYIGNAAFEAAVLCLNKSISYYGGLLAANGGEDLPNLSLDGGKVWLVSATEGMEAAESIHDFRLYRRSGRVFPLLKALVLVQDTESSDPRDQLYGLAGLVHDGRELLRVADYSTNEQHVIGDFVKAYVRQYNDLDVICFFRTMKEVKDWPSWIPDLINRKGRYKLLSQRRADYIYESRGALLYNASAGIKPEPVFSGNMKTLTVNGLFLDTIDGLGWTEDADDVEFELVQSTNPHNAPREESIQDLAATISKLSFDDALASIREALWRTAVANRLGYPLIWQPPPESCRAAFEQLCIDEREGNDPHYFFIKNIRNTRSLLIHGRTLGQWIDGIIVGQERNPNYAPNGSIAQSYLYEASATQTHRCKRFMVTNKGHIGLAPLEARKGDIICLLFGCSLPVTLRPEGDHYKLVGESYLHNFMEGEAITQYTAGEFQQQTFEIR